MESSRLRIIVSGLIAQYPIGGMSWHYLQYVLGFDGLRHDVFYFEDTNQWPYNPLQGGTGRDCDFNVDYLSRTMERFGLGEKWAYRFTGGKRHDGTVAPARWYGLEEKRRREVLETADLLVNVSCGINDLEEYEHVGRTAFVDTDPVFTQIAIAQGRRRPADQHDVHFTFGERLGNRIPTGHAWRPTRQPVVLSQWPPVEARRDTYTTVMNWTSYKPLKYEGQAYGQKDAELRRFLDLPQLIAPARLELALNRSGKTSNPPMELLRHKGWSVVDPQPVTCDLDAYRDYITTSRAEWSVAKGGYVEGKTAWFSERSACYLASGRPVVLQDTGFSQVFETGRGLLGYSTLEEAADCIRHVELDYPGHCRAARRVAAEYFEASAVLQRLIEEAEPSSLTSSPGGSDSLKGDRAE